MRLVKLVEEKHSLEVLFGGGANLAYSFLQESTISLVSRLSINIVVTIVTSKKDYLEDS
jgi:riboflavin biosynthesis pyrimidine reductase